MGPAHLVGQITCKTQSPYYLVKAWLNKIVLQVKKKKNQHMKSAAVREKEKENKKREKKGLREMETLQLQQGLWSDGDLKPDWDEILTTRSSYQAVLIYRFRF